jgi:hypothetical protein
MAKTILGVGVGLDQIEKENAALRDQQQINCARTDKRS